MTGRVALSGSERFEVLKRDKFTCRYCGRSAPGVELHVDHIHPVAKGGTNAPENLCAACVECNLSKSASDITSSLPMPDDSAGADEKTAYLLVQLKRRYSDYSDDLAKDVVAFLVSSGVRLGWVMGELEIRKTFVSAVWAMGFGAGNARVYAERAREAAAENARVKFDHAWGHALKTELLEQITTGKIPQLESESLEDKVHELTQMGSEIFAREDFDYLAVYAVFEFALLMGVDEDDVIIAMAHSVAFYQVINKALDRVRTVGHGTKRQRIVGLPFLDEEFN